MALISGKTCERCLERDKPDVPAEYELDARGPDSGGGGFVCDDCYTSMAEAAHERFLSDYYGGSGPVLIAELSERAYRERAELRRRD
jgi:hypothetical protein